MSNKNLILFIIVICTLAIIVGCFVFQAIQPKQATTTIRIKTHVYDTPVHTTVAAYKAIGDSVNLYHVNAVDSAGVGYELEIAHNQETKQLSIIGNIKSREDTVYVKKSTPVIKVWQKKAIRPAIDVTYSKHGITSVGAGVCLFERVNLLAVVGSDKSYGLRLGIVF